MWCALFCIIISYNYCGVHVSTHEIVCVYMQCAQDFSWLCQNVNIREQFEEDFLKWANAIVKYCEETQQRSSAIQAELENYESDLYIDDGKSSG